MSFYVICRIYLFISLLQAVKIFRATGSVAMLPRAIDADSIMYIAGKPVMHVCTKIYKLYENLQEDQISSLALFLALSSVCTISYCVLAPCRNHAKINKRPYPIWCLCWLQTIVYTKL